MEKEEYNIFLDWINEFKKFNFKVDNEASKLENIVDIKFEKFIDKMQIEASVMILKNKPYLLITEIEIGEDGRHNFNIIFKGFAENPSKLKEILG